MSEILTLREAADLLGVHYMTAYRYVRLGLLVARKNGRTWEVARSDLLLYQQGNVNESSRPLSRRSAPWFERYENRLLAGDQTGAWKVLEGSMISGFSPPEVYEKVLVPALRSIGARWASGEVGIEVEHQASRIVSRQIGQMAPHFTRRGRRLGTVIVAGPPGDQHGFGLAMIADVLRLAGYSVVELGPDTPIDSLERIITREQRLVGVCIGVASTDVLPEARAMIQAARRLLDRSTPLIVGGGAVTDRAQARQMGADELAEISSVVEAIQRGVAASDTIEV